MTDVTINTAPRTISLKGTPSRFEQVAAGTILPGSLLKYTSAGFATQTLAASRNVPRLFALENELLGLGIDDNYVANDFVQAGFFYGGCWILAYLAAAASAVVIGDLLESAGDGSLRKATAVAALADASGTPSGAGTLVDVTATPTQATINNNFATVAAQYSKLQGQGPIAMALDAVDNSGGSGIARIRVVLL